MTTGQGSMIFTRFAAGLKSALVVRLLRRSWDDSRIGWDIASLSHLVKATIGKPIKAGSAKGGLHIPTARVRPPSANFCHGCRADPPIPLTMDRRKEAEREESPPLQCHMASRSAASSQKQMAIDDRSKQCLIFKFLPDKTASILLLSPPSGQTNARNAGEISTAC
jgi:hypothetical protein